MLACYDPTHPRKNQCKARSTGHLGYVCSRGKDGADDYLLSSDLCEGIRRGGIRRQRDYARLAGWGSRYRVDFYPDPDDPPFPREDERNGNG